MQRFTPEEKKRIGEMLRDPGNLYYKMPDGYIPCVDRCTVTHIDIPAPDGPVPCDIIRPREGCTCDVLYINIHGGGFVQIHHDWDTEMCAYYAVELGLTVLDVDYRLAPEYPFPAALDDCDAVKEYCFAHAAELGIDPKKIIIGGNSAGGTLSLNVCMRAHVNGRPVPDFMIMVYPAADMGHGFKEYPEGSIDSLDLKQLEVRADLYNRVYTNDDPEVQECPYCNMLGAPDEMYLDVPDTVMVTAGKDPLHYGAEQLPARLLAAGNCLYMRRFNESNHGFYVRCLGNEWKAARDYVLDLIAIRYGLTRRGSQK